MASAAHAAWHTGTLAGSHTCQPHQPTTLAHWQAHTRVGPINQSRTLKAAMSQGGRWKRRSARSSASRMTRRRRLPPGWSPPSHLRRARGVSGRRVAAFPQGCGCTQQGVASSPSSAWGRLASRQHTPSTAPLAPLQPALQAPPVGHRPHLGAALPAAGCCRAGAGARHGRLLRFHVVAASWLQLSRRRRRRSSSSSAARATRAAGHLLPHAGGRQRGEAALQGARQLRADEGCFGQQERFVVQAWQGGGGGSAVGR